MDYKEKVIALLNSQELSDEQKRKLENIFPELKESEDEKIRKHLICLFKEEYRRSSSARFAGIRVKDIITYLEKQGEQKPENYDHEMWKNCQANFEGGKNEVINNPEKYGLLKPVENSQYQKGFEDALESVKKNWRDYFKPQDVVDIYNEGIKQGIASVKQKPDKWSEEDEAALGDALWCCKQAASIAKDENDMGNVWYAEHWLKSLRPQTTWKPSEEQITVLHDVAAYIDNSIYPNEKDILVNLYLQLKKLK